MVLLDFFMRSHGCQQSFNVSSSAFVEIIICSFLRKDNLLHLLQLQRCRYSGGMGAVI